MDRGRRLASSWPLVGREEELRRVRAAIADGASGVIISGRPGVGKTRLATQAVAEAEEAGACVLWARATRSASRIPFGAFAGLFALEDDATGGISSVQHLFSALRVVADGRETTLGVDDAHLLDDASATFLLQAVERGAATAVVTLGSGEPCPDAVTALWKDAGSLRIELDVMSDSQIGELVATALGGALEHDTRRWVTGTSRGNVLYARELVEGALRDEALVLREGTWHLSRRPGPPSSLRELVTARMGTLGEEQRAVVEILALADDLQVSEVTTIVDESLLATLETAGLITVSLAAGEDSHVRVAHPLYAEIISAETPAARGRAHRRRLARLLSARTPAHPADAVRIALWLTEAGEPVPEAVLLDAACASNLAGIETGIQFAQRALDEGAGIEAAMLLAASHYVHGQPEQAEEVLSSVEGTIVDPALAAAYLRERAAILEWGLGRTGEAVALIERASHWWPGESWSKLVEIIGLPFRALSGKPGETAAAIEVALEDESLSTEARRWLNRALAIDRFWEGRVQAAESLLPAMPSMPLRGELEFTEMAARVAVGLASGSDLRGLKDEMSDAFVAAADAADAAAAGLAAITVAQVCYLGGRFLDAQRWLNEAVVQSERQDPMGTRFLAHAIQAGVSFALSDEARALSAGSRLSTPGRGTEQRGNASWLARGRAWALLARGEATHAQELLLDSAEALDWAPIYAAELLYEAMRAGRRANELSPALSELAELCDAPLTRAYAAHVQARADGDARAALAASELFASLAANLFASEAAAHAASAYAAEGRQDSARQAAARSRELQPDGQGAEPPPIAGIDRTDVELTPREAEMVQLAARGLSNAEIAETLVISTRTVETHIYRAMRKLGVSDRRDFRSVS
jgi:DNA-binding CsgD family transcriptional regulator